MHGDLQAGIPLLTGGLMVLTRVAGAFAFVPIPGASDGRPVARMAVVIAVTAALFPRWPEIAAFTPGWMVLSMVREAALGVALGLVVAFATELLLIAFQVLSLQAGYTFASTIDPTTQADSNVLQVFAQLVSGLLFFSLGLHREVILAFVRSLDAHPAGGFSLKPEMIPEITALGSSVFASGLRLALPVIAFLMILDLSLALMGRINSQLQLIFLAFPVKMLATLGLLAALLLIVPVVYRQFAESVLAVVRKFVSG